MSLERSRRWQAEPQSLATPRRPRREDRSFVLNDERDQFYHLIPHAQYLYLMSTDLRPRLRTKWVSRWNNWPSDRGRPGIRYSFSCLLLNFFIFSILFLVSLVNIPLSHRLSLWTSRAHLRYSSTSRTTFFHFFSCVIFSGLLIFCRTPSGLNTNRAVLNEKSIKFRQSWIFPQSSDLLRNMYSYVAMPVKISYIISDNYCQIADIYQLWIGTKR